LPHASRCAGELCLDLIGSVIGHDVECYAGVFQVAMSSAREFKIVASHTSSIAFLIFPGSLFHDAWLIEQAMTKLERFLHLNPERKSSR
jgi:hypothetical protein